MPPNAARQLPTNVLLLPCFPPNPILQVILALPSSALPNFVSSYGACLAGKVGVAVWSKIAAILLLSSSHSHLTQLPAQAEQPLTHSVPNCRTLLVLQVVVDVTNPMEHDYAKLGQTQMPNDLACDIESKDVDVLDQSSTRKSTSSSKNKGVLRAGSRCVEACRATTTCSCVCWRTSMSRSCPAQPRLALTPLLPPVLPPLCLPPLHRLLLLLPQAQQHRHLAVLCAPLQCVCGQGLQQPVCLHTHPRRPPD